MAITIPAKDIHVGDEIEFTTADGVNHRFVVGQLPKAEIYILPEDVAPRAENMFTLSPRDQVVVHRNVTAERMTSAAAVGQLTAERMAAPEIGHHRWIIQEQIRKGES